MIDVRPAGSADLQAICGMSAAWAAENNVRGYAANTSDDIRHARCFIAHADGAVVGYAVGNVRAASGMGAAIPDGERYFELEDLYVIPEMRGKGCGAAVFRQIEDMLRLEGVKYLYLYTATKDYARILDFYIGKLGMTFWSAQFFKEL